MKKFILLLTLAISYVGFSQNEDDALRYSETFFGGSARYTAMGGSISALGGDFSATSQNPASMAQFNRNNFSFTPILENNFNQSTFYGSESKERVSTLKVGHISYLKSFNLNTLPDPKGWVSVQMGLGYNRLKSFYFDERYEGTVNGSILNSFIDEANGTPTSNIYDAFPLTAGLAYDTYAIDPDPNNTNQYVTTYSGDALHERTTYTTGGVSEYSFLASANYKNKLYVGGSINVNKAKFNTNYTHQETYLSADSIWLNSINYSGYLYTEGTGFNVKIGAIYLINEKLRFGFGLHTPTFYNLNDTYGNDMSTNTDDSLNPDKYIADEFKPNWKYSYRLTTPLKMNFSTAFVFNKKGSVALEMEYIDYTMSKLRDQKVTDYPYNFNTENAQIKNIYTSRINFKIGGEYRLLPRLYLRGGYTLYKSAFNQKSEVDNADIQFFTGGVGFNFGKTYIDFASVFKTNNYNFYAYNSNFEGSHSTFIDRNLNFSVTFGFRID
ncbi:MAG: OmpP1/FadL family transporter [Putridiphycobacter sp.]